MATRGCKEADSSYYCPAKRRSALRLWDEDQIRVVCPNARESLTILHSIRKDGAVQEVFDVGGGQIREDTMSFLDACSTWLDTLVLIAWQFLQSSEGSQAIASVGGVLIILYYLRQGALPGGRMAAILLSAIFAVGLWGLVVLAATFLDANSGQKCRASPLLNKVAAKHPAK
jgi:hypothetical protein